MFSRLKARPWARLAAATLLSSLLAFAAIRAAAPPASPGVRHVYVMHKSGGVAFRSKCVGDVRVSPGGAFYSWVDPSGKRHDSNMDVVITSHDSPCMPTIGAERDVAASSGTRASGNN